MKEPYQDDQNTKGILIFSKEELEEIFSKAHKNGLQIAAHAIGDGAIELNADLLNELSEKPGVGLTDVVNDNDKVKINLQVGENPLRHGIVHAQFTNKEILNKMKKGGLLAYIQPVFVDSDMKIAEKRVGEKRLEKAYAWKSMSEMDIRTAGGSDAPVEGFDIMDNVYFAVTRKDRKGNPEGGLVT
jgi:hypothetical protein